ncbi:MAG: hypothetical protein NTZ46_10270 [Verrucomicrobia bacterium]|nr:hypothetical protein [Verrucomicrobiota bacterium]
MIPVFSQSDRIPPDLGDLSLQSFIEAEDKDLGVQIRYTRGATRADVYLYDFGTSGTKSISHSDSLEHFKACCSDVLSLADAGFYRNVKLEQCDGWELEGCHAGTCFIHAQFSFQIPDTQISIDVGEQISHLLLTTFKGFFLKVRFSYPANSHPDRILDIREFLFDLLTKLKTA